MKLFRPLLIALAITIFSVWIMPAAAGAATTCTASTMFVVAHEDDTLIFQDPALQQNLASGACVQSVFLTAGDDGKSQSYWGTREEGVKAAYAQLAGVANKWSTTTTTVNGHLIATATLEARPTLSLIFMRLPDGGYPRGLGNPLYNNQSLMQLWNGGNNATPAETSITSVDNANTYTYQGLITTLTGLMTSFKPQVIATQNYTAEFNGEDHNDHVATAYFTRAAQKSYATPHELVAYEGYETDTEAANVSGSPLESKQSAFYLYSGYDVNGCASATLCASSPYSEWVRRQYIAASEVVGSQVATNIAPQATATASSQTSAYGQTAAKAIDGVISGYPNNIEAEWSSEGGKTGTWLNLKWAKSYSVEKVILFDRPNTNDQITSGTLTFSDGSTVNFAALPNNGSTGLTVTFPAKTTNSLKMTVTGVSSTTANVGLSEIQVFGVPAEGSTENQPPTANAGSTQSVGSGAAVMLDGSASSDPEGQALTYQWTQTAGTAVTLSSASAVRPTFTAPKGPATLAFSLTVSDGQKTSAASTVKVEVAAAPTATNIAPQATATASSQTSAYGQTAAKAIDGVISGYPNNIEAEWSSEGGKTGTWLNLKWAKSYSVEKVILFDRPNTNDQITSGTLTFSDGSTVNFAALPNNGSTGLTVTFPAKTTNSLKMTVTGVSSTTANVGLSEIQVFGVPAEG